MNGNEVGIEGVSRRGKAALITMAFDKSFRIVLVGSSGKGVQLARPFVCALQGFGAWVVGVTPAAAG
ncbi:MAG: hypothetical protein ACP5M4_00075 [Acidobacteriaceae bacterium]